MRILTIIQENFDRKTSRLTREGHIPSHAGEAEVGQWNVYELK